jgi:hypothetical protein
LTDYRKEKEVNTMTLNGTASSWEPMELRLVGQVEDVMLGGGQNDLDCHNLPPGKTVPATGDPGEPCLKPPGQEGK